jgi:hypothetical protein
MGLCRGQVQSISMGFYVLPTADDKEALTCQSKKIRTNKNRKVSVKEWSIPRLGLGGLNHEKRRKIIIKV